MDIRSLQTEDIEPIVEIWFQGSLMAHHFIDREYWESRKMEMNTMTNLVCQERDKKVLLPRRKIN